MCIRVRNNYYAHLHINLYQQIVVINVVGTLKYIHQHQNACLPLSYMFTIVSVYTLIIALIHQHDTINEQSTDR